MKGRRDPVRLAWWAVVVRFLLHGLIVGTWVSRIPAIQSSLALSNRVLGLCLLGMAVGSVVSAPVTGWLNTRFGSKRLTAWSTIAFSVTLLAPTLATNPAMLFCTLVFFGASGAANDISMNSQAVAVEQALGSPTMSRFHAMFSVGGMAGAGVGGIIAAQELSPRLHFAIAVVCFLLLAVTTAPWLLETPAARAGRRTRLSFKYLSPALVALVVVGFSMFLAEAAIGDWSAVYLKQSLGAGPGMAAAAYAVFSIGMTIFRLLGDEITARIGPVATVRGGGLLAAVGLSWALLAGSAVGSLPGFALAGAGFSSIIPLVFGAGGRIRSVPSSAGVAFVAGAGYIGFLFGPPVIGLLAARTSLRSALFLIVALSLTAATLAGAVEIKKAPITAREEQ